MLTHKKLKEYYFMRQKEVQKRLKEFSTNSKKMTDKELFLELSFCICTPQSKAIKVAEVINKNNIDKLMTLSQSELAQLLRKNTRFHNNKAKHIINARKYLSTISNLKNSSKDGELVREFLVKNIKGIGYKESSHYLRNIGYRKLCIVDRHIITLMHELGVFDDLTIPSTPKKYLEMEQKIKSYAKKYNYDVDELDLVLWSIKTGHVFK
jgi:N-glycosylase/DNA lyase